MAKAAKNLEERLQRPKRTPVTSRENLLPNYGRGADEVSLTLRVPVEFRDRLKVHAAMKQASMKDVVVEAVEALLEDKKHH